MHYKTNNRIEPGMTYTINSPDRVPVTALKAVSSDEALFVSEEFNPAPFVIWQYNLLDNGFIELYRGRYFRTLDEALKEVSL